ncbi:hypothetical protein BCU68_01060 [Vibrio sp. 10N.286.49.B3]|uniref:response regulator n=1 Tax=Vibrio sp. 10N.286.49.B3 TaxID=1880855 RepID=UPI000C830352|nr:response regulator [Vibrio sp. 10N.286.49.B3]PMH46654.1 hypothetical protein BCU68_01060 [Vibrio sp. 10N.286.49.B3]
MNKYLILCVDDEREILDCVLHDLARFESHFILEGAQSVHEAKSIIAECAEDGIELALILCDHIMPGETGIDFLIELSESTATQDTRKVLLTGQAGLEETVEAVNHASLDFYLSKPWDGEALCNIITAQLSQYVISHDSQLLSWVSILDSEAILNAAAKNRTNFSD